MQFIMTILDIIQIFIPYACSEGSCLFSWEILFFKV